jgi:hypothetical protein
MSSIAVDVEHQATQGRVDRWSLEALVLEVLSHPRYRGDYLLIWRIADAVALPLSPVAIHWCLKRAWSSRGGSSTAGFAPGGSSGGRRASETEARADDPVRVAATLRMFVKARDGVRAKLRPRR